MHLKLSWFEGEDWSSLILSYCLNNVGDLSDLQMLNEIIVVVPAVMVWLSCHFRSCCKAMFKWVGNTGKIVHDYD